MGGTSHGCTRLDGNPSLHIKWARPLLFSGEILERSKVMDLTCQSACKYQGHSKEIRDQGMARMSGS